MKGWGNNKRGEYRRKKTEITNQLTKIDEELSQVQGITEMWELRYKLEDELEQLYEAEESYWRQRGGADTQRGFKHLFLPYDSKWEEEEENKRLIGP